MVRINKMSAIYNIYKTEPPNTWSKTDRTEGRNRKSSRM